MKTRILAILGVLALAGWVATPALANDGGTEPAKGEPAAKKDAKPAGEAPKEGKDAPARCDGDKGPCCPAKDEASCGNCDEGAEAGSECCKEKVAKRNALLAALAAMTGEGDAAKKVLGAVPAEAAKKVEEARKAAFDAVVKVRGELGALQKRMEAIVAKAKADGQEACCSVTGALEHDAEALKKKCHDSMESFAKFLGETLGAEKVQALGVEAQKAGDVMKAFHAKVEAAAQAAEAKKAAKAKCADEDGDDDEDECDDEEDDEKGECEKKCEKSGEAPGKSDGKCPAGGDKKPQQ